jgi:hypothetical protein
MPKMDFPHFDGTDVRVWLDKCSAYFHLYGIPYDFRVRAATLTWLIRLHTGFSPISSLGGPMSGRILLLQCLGSLSSTPTISKPCSY